MLRGTPARVLREWAAYYRLEPWGEDRADARTAIVAAVVHNVSHRRGGARPVRDFMAHAEPRARSLSAGKAMLLKHFLGVRRADAK